MSTTGNSEGGAVSPVPLDPLWVRKQHTATTSQPTQQAKHTTTDIQYSHRFNIHKNTKITHGANSLNLDKTMYR